MDKGQAKMPSPSLLKPPAKEEKWEEKWKKERTKKREKSKTSKTSDHKLSPFLLEDYSECD
jgi:hypothetical protein